MEKLSGMGVAEQRSLEEDCAELVFYAKENDDWKKALEGVFGPAIKPAGVNPVPQDLSLTQTHGGIRRDQALYKKDFDGYVVLAMLWPWQDKIYTTLKISKI